MALTRREFVSYVFFGALALIFCPPLLRPLRDSATVLCVTWLANRSFDLWETKWWVRTALNYSFKNVDLDFQPTRDIQKLLLIINERLDELYSWFKYYSAEICRFVRIAGLNARLRVGELLARLTGDSEAERTRDAKPRCTKYYALLVTTPPVHFYGAVSDHLSNFQANLQPLPWASYTTDSIPPLLNSLVFRTHLAFCLVRKADWESCSLTLFQKLQNQRFWDLQGQDTGDIGVSWSRDQIAKIDRIENLSLVDMDKDVVEICTQYYVLLRRGWTYYNIWWNDVDFALLLAYLVVGTRSGSKCAVLTKRFDKMRYKEVIESRVSACKNSFMAAWCFTALSGILVPATGGLAALPLLGAATGFGSVITGMGLCAGDDQRWQRRQEARCNLVKRIPELKTILQEEANST